LLFSTRLFGLLTKSGHSIPRPLDLDIHIVKRPLVHLWEDSLESLCMLVSCKFGHVASLKDVAW
jgi:hypothetical protein